MKKGWWSITYNIEPTEASLEHIAECVKKGYLEGEIIQEEDDFETKAIIDSDHSDYGDRD